MSIQCLLSSVFCFGLLFSVFVFHFLDIIIKHLSNSIMVIYFAQRISRDWLWKVHLPWLAIKGKGMRVWLKKRVIWGVQIELKSLQLLSRLEECFTWRFEGLLSEFPMSSRWISFHSPALKYLEILGNAFCYNMTRKYHPNEVGWYLAPDSSSRSTKKIWEAGISNSGPRNRQPFSVKLLPTRPVRWTTWWVCLYWPEPIDIPNFSFSVWPLSAKWGTAQSYYGIVHRFVW
jgi:hypothetical protein